MGVVTGVPWIAIALVVFNVAVFGFGPDDTGGQTSIFLRELLSATLPSGASMRLTVGDGMIVLTLLTLFLELMKASRNAGFSVMDNALSVLLFLVCLVEFLTVPQAANSVFFVILAVTFIDVMAGFIISLQFARRDLSIEPG